MINTAGVQRQSKTKLCHERLQTESGDPNYRIIVNPSQLSQLSCFLFLKQRIFRFPSSFRLMLKDPLINLFETMLRKKHSLISLLFLFVQGYFMCFDFFMISYISDYVIRPRRQSCENTKALGNFFIGKSFFIDSIFQF